MTVNTPDLFVDRVPVSNYLSRIISQWRLAPTKSADFWSSAERPVGDPTQEVVEFELNGLRLINFISLRTAHFPHTVWAEYFDEDTAEWAPLRTVLPGGSYGSAFFRPGPDGKVPVLSLGSPASYTVTDSMPIKVNDRVAVGFTHPQHFGHGHWLPVSWGVRPVHARRVRMRMARSGGIPPANPMGAPAAYSLGLRDVQIGYRINSRADVPMVAEADEDFASSVDLLGSRVLFSLRENAASNAISGDGSTFWRCDPQPVNYAVVNFYVDTRDATGLGQVIDRFYLDPVTVGPHLNLYYSNDEPTGAYESLDTPLAYPTAKVTGTFTAQTLGAAADADTLVFSQTAPTYVDLDNAHLQLDLTRPLWVGMEMRATTGADGFTAGVSDHPWLSIGANVLRLNGGQIEFTAANGQQAVVPLDPSHAVGARFSVALILNPNGTNLGDYLDGVTLVYRLGDLAPVSVTVALENGALGDRPDLIALGRYPDAANPGISALSLRALVLKTDDPPVADDISWFLQSGMDYVSKGRYAPFDSGSTRNALLRLHPAFADEANPSGLVGGPGDRFADMVWSPVNRDYALKRGYMYLPPTRAKYFKFEFTQLVAEHYESFVPIRRTINMFSPQTVNAYLATTAGGSSNPLDAGAGIQTMVDLAEVSRYADAVGLLREPLVDVNVNHTATEALYVYDPVQQDRIAQQGWIWSFQPWHVGSSAPRFIGQQKHTYEQVTVNHRTKTAYFVGLKSLSAYRVDFAADTDTDMYVEHFHDAVNISTTSGVSIANNQVTSYGYAGEITSKVLNSERRVRGVQFATIQSDSYPMLADDGFVADDLGQHWSVYGDATLVRYLNRTVEVNRGWYARTYQMVEDQFIDYADLEGRLYAEVEGALPNGLVGGGIQSEAVTPSNSGRIYAAAKVSSLHDLTTPVRLEIVSVETDSVLASTSRMLHAGEEAAFYVGYAVGTAQNPLRYSDLEGQQYADLDLTFYRDHESTTIYGDVYARLIQPGPASDAFTIKRLSLFDAPLSWEFSVDGGTTWYDAMDVRNNVDGVLTFPEPGTQLCWRLSTYRPGISVSALAIRPWYTGRGAVRPGNTGVHMLGPNKSVVDEYPPLEQDPMWQQSNSPIPAAWYRKDPTAPLADSGAGTPLYPQSNRPAPYTADAQDTVAISDSAAAVVN